jgi:hypothetical protein
MPDEEDSSPPTIGHFSDSIFQANYETVHENQHPYNTRSKYQSNSQNPSPVPNKNTTSNQKKQTKAPKNFFVPDLDYDPIEDFKKLKANISIYELLKFPYIQQKCYRV